MVEDMVLRNDMRVLFIRMKFLLVVATLTACGGGGGGGGGNGIVPVTYNGNTSAALVDISNAHDLARNSYEHSSSGTASVGAFAASLSDPHMLGQDSGLPRAVNVIRSVLSMFEQVNVQAMTEANPVAKATVSVSDTLSGSCGGSAKLTLSADDQTGVFSGRISYSNFCEMEVVIGGDMTVSGVIDLFWGSIESITLNFAAVRTQVQGASVTITGSIALSIPGSSAESLLNMVMRNDTTGFVYQLENMQVDVTSGAGYVDMTMEGRIYEPIQGYLDVTTVSAFRVYDGNNWPSSGELIGVGAVGGLSGNTQVRFRAFTSTYLVEADTTGDGSFDFSQTYDWE